MNREKIFFKEIKEPRDWYFVEYSPPIEGYPIAFLNLVVPDEADKAKIAEAMESELHAWLTRYPIPLEITAWDEVENVICLDPIKESNSLMGYLPKGEQKPIFRWGAIRWEDLPQDALNRSYLKSIYTDVPFKTTEDIERESKKHNRMVLTVWWFFFVWAVVVPLTVLIIGETNLILPIGQHQIHLSLWVSRMVLAFSLWKIVVEILKRTGKWKKSSRQLEREKEELKRDHHHYHCKKNPQAFHRLRSENFEREARERVRKEAESLKRVSSPPCAPKALFQSAS